MKYYFSEDKNIRVYNGDCIEVMDKLISMGVTVDCVACDPAYKITARGDHGNSGGMLADKRSMRGDLFKENSCDVSVWMPKVYDILKESGHCYIMCNHKNLVEYLNTAEKCGLHFIKSLIWKKDNKIMGQYYMSQFEYILFFRKGKGVRINNCGTSDVLEFPNKKLKDSEGKNLHNTEKPIELMEVLVNNSTKEGEVVLDFMNGIGATGLACQRNNRKYIGIELDETYFDITIKRLKGEI